MADPNRMRDELARAKARSAESKRKAAAAPRGERTEAPTSAGDIWKDVGLSALSGLRSGAEGALGAGGDIAGMQQALAGRLFGKTGADVAKYTSPLSVMPSSEDIGAITDKALAGTGAQDVTRHQSATPFGQAANVGANVGSGFIGGPETLLTKLAMAKGGLGLAAAPLAVGRKIKGAVKAGAEEAGAVKRGGQYALPKGKGAKEAASYDPYTARAPGEPLKPKKPEAITAVSLRGMPLDKAAEIAASERHIIPNKRGFVGAPAAAQSRSDIDTLRANFDRDVGLGGGGADWYERAQDWIKSVAGPEPARQHELAQNLALFSAQRDPNVNLGLSIAARNQSAMDMPLTVGGTDYQKRVYGQGFKTGQDIPLGEKTGIYAQHLDPTMESPSTGTNDIWHARALGYGEPELKGGLSPQQHSWMDAETVLAMDRANRAETAGRTDWTPGEVQAAPWVTGKARGLESRLKWAPEKAMAEAVKTYPDYAPAYTGFGTHEMATGKQTGHLPGVDLNDEPGSWWQGPGGRDQLYEAQGAYVAPTIPGTGVFDQGGGDVVFNPMQSAQPLISYTGGPGERVVDPASKQMMTGTEAFRAMMDAQDAGAWSATIPGQKMSHSNAFAVPLPEDREGLSQLMATAKGVNRDYDVLPQPNQRALVTDFTAKPGIGKDEKKAVQAALPGAEPVRREGELINYGQDFEDPTKNPWRGSATPGGPIVEGSDQVTRLMLSKLNPAQEAAFSKPEVRAAVLAKFDRDQQLAAKTGKPIRKDLQFARDIFAKEGIAGLRDNLGKGLLPAVAVGAFLPYAMGSGSRTGGGT